MDRAMVVLDLTVDAIVLKVQPPPVLIAIIAYFAGAGQSVVPSGGRRVLTLSPIRAPPVYLPSVTNSRRSKSPQPHRPDGWTSREHEVVRSVTEGLSNKETALHLGISSSTVRHHLTMIFDKLGVASWQKLLFRAHLNVSSFR